MNLQSSGYVVVLLFVSVIVVSGCADSTTTPEQDSPQQTDEASDGSPENQETSTETSGDTEPANLSLTSFDVPEEVEMGETFNVRVTIENTGGETGELETSVMMRTEDSETFGDTGSVIESEIPAGEEKTLETSMTPEGVSTGVISLAGIDVESDIRIVPKKVKIGEEYSTQDGLGITVESAELQDSYRYENYLGEEAINEPESGQYLFVDLKTQNQGETPKSLPLKMDFQLLANNRQYEPVTVFVNEPVDKGSKYEGGEVQPGIVREGYIVFEVPEDVTESDISIVWNEVISLTEKSVYWVP